MENFPKLLKLMLKVRCFQRGKKKVLNCGIYEQTGEKNNPQRGHSEYLTVLLQVNKQEPGFSPLGEWEKYYLDDSDMHPGMKT